jgi:(p)ppGpp synthase/HD superfamily hydrolase
MPTFTIDDAIALAATAHAGQRDKGRPSVPYVTHPIRIMATFDDPILQMIAVLHDVVEDSDVSLDDLRAAGAPERVIDAVALLTHTDGEDRDAYLRRIHTNPDALAVKLADNADNSDPARLALLDALQADRLRAKYEHDRQILLEG